MPATRPRGGQSRSQQIQSVAPISLDKSQSAQLYLRKAKLLLTQADAYRAKGNIDQLYAMLYRYAILILQQVPKLPDHNAHHPAYEEHRQLLRTRYMPELEALKLKVDSTFDNEAVWETKLLPNTVRLSSSNLDGINWQLPGAHRHTDGRSSNGSGAALASAAAGAAAAGSLVGGLQSLGIQGVSSAPAVPSVLPSAPPLPGATMSDDMAKLSSLGADLSSFRLRPASKEAMSKHAVLASDFGTDLSQAPSLPVEALPVSRTHSKSLYPVFEPHVQDDVAIGSAGAAALLSAAVQPGVAETGWVQGPTPGPVHSGYEQAYQQAHPPWQGRDTVQVVVPPTATGTNSVAELLAMSTVPPGLALGPQQVEIHTVAPTTGPPGAACGTCAHPPPPPPPPPEATAVAPTQAIVTTNGVKPIAKRKALRDVHVSLSLMEDFLRYATANTNRGIESCGILAGTLSTDESIFLISTLIIPKQEGTSDTVQALNEEEIFEVQDSRALYPLGWIHTHPTQTCFLSSIDVHTQCGYQTMLEEAVAIVMAPRDRSKRMGMFRLTTPGGLKLVQKCSLRGFHTHPSTDTGQEIYELVGHVYLNDRVRHDIVDLR